MAEALPTEVPMAVLVFVNDSWFSYGGGIIYPAECESTDINNSVLLVGVHVSDDLPFMRYWRLKNSWDVSWGE